ncbi:DNA recombination protein RmuC [Micrococcales bacterium 31B]|nr:DNA recombination protein RmuC [Micrococcales bacterium 31B]
MDLTALLFGVLLGLVAGVALSVWLMLRWFRRHQSEVLAAAPSLDHNALAGAVHSVASQAIQHNQQQFLQLAEERLKRATEANRNELQAKTVAFETMVDPLHQSLEKVQRALTESERLRVASSAALNEKLTQVAAASHELRGETRQLINALRAPHQRGAWGELQLRRLVEAAGMLPHCDFTEQTTVRNAQITGDDETLVADGAARSATLRPDLIVNLPGGRHLVVDSKAPLQAFLDAYDATDETTRKASLARCAAHLRKHVDQLSGKQYWESVAGSPEYVIMFLPSDHLLTTAHEADPHMYEYASQRQVVIATPGTLIALLRTVGFAWRTEAVTSNAQEVLAAGRTLYERVARFSENFDLVGRRLEASVKAYNTAVGTYEGRVLPASRKFVDLQVTEQPVKEPRAVETHQRAIVAPELTENVRHLA